MSQKWQADFPQTETCIIILRDMGRRDLKYYLT